MAQSTMGHLRSDIKRSEGVLDSIQLHGEKLTQPGKEWIIAAFDPFHDRDVDCSGYPDASNENSMVQCKTITLQVSCPASVTTGTWDCHIVDWPFLGPAGSAKTISANQWLPVVPTGGNVAGSVFQAGSTLPNLTTNFGGLCAYTFATSASNDSPFTGNILSAVSSSLNPQDITNNYRVIGKAFEVYNTTPDLYKSGAVCVYSQPIPDFSVAPTASLVNLTVNNVAPVSVNLCPAPPATSSEALQLGTSRQWDAREGCYVISKLNRCEIPNHLGNWTQPIFYAQNPNDATMYGTGESSSIPFTSTTPAANIGVFPDQNWTCFDMDGAIFSGLSLQTTLTINFRMYIEVFPSSNNSLSNFARPSPVYDAGAIELYARISHKAPIGVEVKFNGLGDWFMDGIKSVSAALGPAAKALAKVIPHKGLQAASMAMNGVNKVYKGEQKQLPKVGKKMNKKLEGLELPQLMPSGKQKKKKR